MFAGWLKFACALLCAFLLPLLGATGEAVHIDAGAESGAAKWCGAANPGAAWLSGARRAGMSACGGGEDRAGAVSADARVGAAKRTGNVSASVGGAGFDRLASRADGTPIKARVVRLLI